MDNPKLVDYRVDAGIAILSLNDPPANAYSYAMMRELDDAILSARFDDDVHVILLTGSGTKFFSAGANLNALKEMQPRYKYWFCLHANETLNRLEQTSKLTIAALNGHAVGGGLEVALACDLRWARSDSGMMGLPEVNLGVLPGTGGTQRLVRALGKAQAIELMISGRLFSFDEGQKLGLVQKLVPGPDFMARVLELARAFVPPAKASLAVGHIKRACQSGWDMSFEGGLALERELQQRLFESGDAKEGIAAFVEKRTAEFRGR